MFGWSAIRKLRGSSSDDRAQELLRSGSVAASLPVSVQAARTPLQVLFSYLIIVAVAFTFLELTLGTLRRFLQIHLVADVAVAVAGITLFVVSGSQDSLLGYNELLVVILLVALVLTLSIPSLSRRASSDSASLPLR